MTMKKQHQPYGYAKPNITSSGGTIPDGKVTSPFVPFVVRDDARIDCVCTWGSYQQGEMYLRFRNDACRVKALGGHE